MLSHNNLSCTLKAMQKYKVIWRFTIRKPQMHQAFIHSFLQRLFKSTTTPRRSRQSTDTESEFHAKAPQATESEGLAQGPYVAARAGFEPTTLRPKGDETTNEPPRPTWFTLNNSQLKAGKLNNSQLRAGKLKHQMHTVSFKQLTICTRQGNDYKSFRPTEKPPSLPLSWCMVQKSS